ncbi:unnamed protein product [Brassica rapa]|uniref:Uncharacterized protein n=1 Tax=Brassica campestris TaxID=3711 RepID=A0A8D9G1L8_BRACM|nr:unnamed protein product [Brassica rapa]
MAYKMNESKIGTTKLPEGENGQTTQTSHRSNSGPYIQLPSRAVNPERSRSILTLVQTSTTTDN